MRLTEVPTAQQLGAFIDRTSSESANALNHRLAALAARVVSGAGILAIVDPTGALVAIAGLESTAQYVDVEVIRAAGGSMQVAICRRLLHYVRQLAAENGIFEVRVRSAQPPYVIRALSEEVSILRAITG